MMEKPTSPMMMQYFEIKEKCKDYIVFYRLGDFYEMFFEDAILASKELDLTLTGRSCGSKERAPMCGVPYHSSEAYIARLVAKGHKVAICEQTEDAASAKGIVRREIVRMITPGTIMETSMLSEDKNNYISAVYAIDGSAGICFADISTGKLYASKFQNNKNLEQELINEISKFMPREILLPENSLLFENLKIFLKDKIHIENINNDRYLCSDYDELLQKQFLNTNIDIKNIDIYVKKSIAGMLSYLNETQMSNLKNLTTLNCYMPYMYMDIDITARRNLEICESINSASKKNTLLGVLDKTKTAMGTRMLRTWLEKPLLNIEDIKKRQDATEELIKDFIGLDELRLILANITDIERLIGRAVHGSANGRDLQSLAGTINYIPNIIDSIKNYHSDIIKDIFNNLDRLDDIKNLIKLAIADEPPANVRDGSIIKKGYSEELDNLRSIANGGKDKILEVETRERAATGIKTLKVSFNKVAGYYIEVTKANIKDVPQHYTRKQTLTNAERYITDELKAYEDEVLSAQDKSLALELEIFTEIRNTIAISVHRVQKTANAIAILDVLAAFASVARISSYIKPEISLNNKIDIKDGRHPVVEKIETMFIENDTHLDDINPMAIITGPNMAGKSTYMRQVALIVIMAQIGSFVPASYASIGICDKVFTRIGASDDLSGGKSTFMVEMSEVSYILDNATKNSLVLLDEIGRGTSTYDGMSIARAVSEYILVNIKAKTLFATHYHELSSMENELSGVINYNIAVTKTPDEQIVFLRKIIHGSADKSYGIEVARLAGISPIVIDRANVILAKLESSDNENSFRNINLDEHVQNIKLQDNLIEKELSLIDINSITPMEALGFIHKLKTMIQE